MRRAASTHRFTLIEIMVVTVLVGLLVSVALIKVDSLIPSYRLKKHVHGVADTIELAFSEAAVEGRELELHFDAEKRLTILDYPATEEKETENIFDNPPPEPPTSDEPPTPVYSLEWEEGVSLEQLEVASTDGETKESILFSPMGYADGARITFKEQSGAEQTLELWSLTGKVIIHDLQQREY